VHETPQWNAACPARALTDLLLERFQGFITHLASVGPTPHEREAQERPAPGAVHGTFSRIHRELQASCEEAGDTSQHAVPRSNIRGLSFLPFGPSGRSAALLCRLLTPPLGSGLLTHPSANFRGMPHPKAPGRPPGVSCHTVRA
jgi:hypothetical protein